MQWESMSSNDNTWEDLDQLMEQYQNLDLGDKVCFNGGGNVLAGLAGGKEMPSKLEELLNTAHVRGRSSVLQSGYEIKYEGGSENKSSNHRRKERARKKS